MPIDAELKDQTPCGEHPGEASASLTRLRQAAFLVLVVPTQRKHFFLSGELDRHQLLSSPVSWIFLLIISYHGFSPIDKCML